MRQRSMRAPGRDCKVNRPCIAITIPNELRSFEDAERRAHRDLPRLDDFGLWREGQQVRLALVYSREGPDREWLLERHRAVTDELGARARSRGEGRQRLAGIR